VPGTHPPFATLQRWRGEQWQASVTGDDHAAQHQDEEPLGNLVRVGLIWSLANNGLGRIITFGSTVVLAHLLTPKDFGVFSVALVAMTLLMSLNDVGIAAVLVRWRGSLDEVGPTATTLIFVASCVLFVGMFLGAPAFADALNAPSATGVVRLMCVGLIIDATAAVPAASLTRSMLQQRRTFADITGSLIGITVSILLALAGKGAWSLAWGRIVTNAVVAGMVFFLAPERYRPGFNTDAARRLLEHGLRFAGSTVLAIAVLNVDYLIVGHVLGPTELGYYLLAFNISSWPINVIATAVRRVTVAAFARVLHRPEALDSGFRQAITLTVAAAVPVCALLAALAPEVIRIVYGSEWAPAASALRWLAVLGLARVMLDISWDLLVAANRSRAVLFLNGVWLALLIPVLTAGAHLDSIQGVGIGHVLVAVVFMMPLYGAAVHGVGVHLRHLGTALLRPAVGGILVALVALGASALFSRDLVIALVGGGLGVLCYGLVIYPMRTMFPRMRPAPV
jgi:PST family polysaccharide transporter